MTTTIASIHLQQSKAGTTLSCSCGWQTYISRPPRQSLKDHLDFVTDVQEAHWTVHFRALSERVANTYHGAPDGFRKIKSKSSSKSLSKTPSKSKSSSNKPSTTHTPFTTLYFEDGAYL